MARSGKFSAALLSEKAILSLIILLSSSHATFESRGGLWLCISVSIVVATVLVQGLGEGSFNIE